MSEKTEKSVIIENTPSALFIKKEEKSAMFVEVCLGCILIFVAIIFTMVTSVLIQVLEVVPTNLVLVKSILQLLLFTISNKNTDVSITAENRSTVTVQAVQGFLSSLAFICSIGAVRLLPLGDVFSIIFIKTVFIMLLMSGFAGRAMTKKKTAVTIVSMLGLVLLIKNHTCYNCHQDGLIGGVDPLADPNSSIWIGFGLAFMYNIFSSKAEVLMLEDKSGAGELSFWSSVGGLVTAVMSSFFCSESSIMSGAMPSVRQILLLVSLSISAMVTKMIIAHVETRVSKTFVKVIKSLEIPLGFLSSLGLSNSYLPSNFGYLGVVLIVISAVSAQATLEDEEEKNESKDSSNYSYEVV
eukprot:GFUD01006054.1.p1 GENE.GFUD01006054.1~~GFUD01006054.1.p1  ORF type:complete len:354 (+),score=90.63 GFUD01006054.1:359-1420(+)